MTLALVSAEDGQGHTPLHAAATMGNAEIAQLLLEAGDDPNHVGPDGFAPIHRAVQGEGLGHTEVVELLLKHGVSVNQPAADGWGETPERGRGISQIIFCSLGLSGEECSS